MDLRRAFGYMCIAAIVGLVGVPMLFMGEEGSPVRAIGGLLTIGAWGVMVFGLVQAARDLLGN